MSSVELGIVVALGIGATGLLMACLSILSQEIREWIDSRKDRSTNSTQNFVGPDYDPNEFKCVPAVATSVAAYSEMNEGLTMVLNEGLPAKTMMVSEDLYESFKSATKEVE